MSEKNSSFWAAYRDPRWQRRRLEIMERDRFACRSCGDKSSTLNVHHHRYAKGRKPWEYGDHDLSTLCDACHDEQEHLKVGIACVYAHVMQTNPDATRWLLALCQRFEMDMMVEHDLSQVRTLQGAEKSVPPLYPPENTEEGSA